MNKELLYDSNRLCKLCKADRDDQEHTDDCPGKIIEGLTFYVHYEGPNCTRGCCGRSEGEVSSEESFEDCVAKLVPATSDAVRVYYTCRLAYEESIAIGPMVEAERLRQRAEKEAKERAAREVQAQKDFDAEKARDFAALMAQKDDLTPEAYSRRHLEIVGRVRT